MKPDAPIEERLSAVFGIFYACLFSAVIWLVLFAIYYGYKACHS